MMRYQNKVRLPYEIANRIDAARFKKKFQVTLPRPDGRDERKVWCYGAGLKGKWAAVDSDWWVSDGSRVYTFDVESDAMMFCLVWGGDYASVDIKP